MKRYRVCRKEWSIVFEKQPVGAEKRTKFADDLKSRNVTIDERKVDNLK